MKLWNIVHYLPRIPHNKYRYRTLHLSSSTEFHQQLYEDWGIFNAEGFYECVDQLLAGMHSKPFAAHMAFRENDKRIDLMANLTDTSAEYIINCSRSINNALPILIWGFDLWRAIALCRGAFCANFINEEQAWQTMLPIADIVYELFPNQSEFHKNYRLGVAFWCNNYQIVKNRINQFENYQKNCNWPLKELAWPKNKKVVLSEEIRTGFSQYIEELKNSDVVSDADALVQLSGHLDQEMTKIIH